MPRLIQYAVLAGFLVACASMPQLPPKENWQEVEVYQADIGQQPEGNYRALTDIRIERPVGTAPSALIQAAQEAAARIGADAILINPIRRSTPGEIATRGEEEMILEGIAIYWPDRPR